MSTVTAFLLSCQASYILTGHGSRVTGHEQDPFPATLKAMIWVESRGDPNAVGDGGRAIGPYQMHKGYWKDATGFLGVDWPYQDARDPVKAAMAVEAYTRHYAEYYKLQLTPEVIARLHVGGPRGPFRKSSIPYWLKVKQVMEDQT